MRVVGLAALVAAGVAASGFAIQWAALPDAGKGDVVAARAVVWLGRYRETASRLVVDGRTLRGLCYHGWIRGRRGTFLRLSDGASVSDLPPHTLRFRGGRPTRPIALLDAAGCTKVLADRLATFAEFHGHTRARHATIDGAGAWAVDFPHLTLYVDRANGRPLGVTSFDIRGRFRFVRITPRTAGL
jgi:hypothetical protein